MVQSSYRHRRTEYKSVSHNKKASRKKKSLKKLIEMNFLVIGTGVAI